jgi:hypothetical protein
MGGGTGTPSPQVVPLITWRRRGWLMATSAWTDGALIAEGLRNEVAGVPRLTDDQRARLVLALELASPPCPIERRDDIYRTILAELGREGETVPDVARAEMAGMALEVARSKAQREAVQKQHSAEVIKGPW